MAFVKGVNCGFVAVAPTSSPGGSSVVIPGSIAVPDTAPVGSAIIKEIGWYQVNTPTPNINYQVGIYTDTGLGYPKNLIGVSRTNESGTTSGWKVVPGLNISIIPGVVYWIAVQVTGSDLSTTSETIGGTGRSYYTSTQLDDPWGSTNTGPSYRAFYAVWDIAPKIPIVDVKGSSWYGVKKMREAIQGTKMNEIKEVRGSSPLYLNQEIQKIRNSI